MAAGDWKELYLSAQNGNLELVKYHIRMGVDPNHQHPEYMPTPLIVSIENQHIEIVEFLLKNGSDATIKEDFGHHTPLSMAKFTKNQKLIDLINADL